MYSIMVATAGNAIRKKYPITADEISQLCRQFDTDTGNWYKNRPLDKEADRALEYVYKNL
jgi:plasmid maintenance system antidote protein VapI